MGGGRTARGLRACQEGPLCLPGAASASHQRFPLPRPPRLGLGQRCLGAPHSSLHTGALLGLFHAGAAGGEEGVEVEVSWVRSGKCKTDSIQTHTSANEHTPRQGEEFVLGENALHD